VSFFLEPVIFFDDFAMAEQRASIKFCFLLGKTVTMLREAFKEEALSQARVYEWFSRFKRGDMSLEDQPRSGRPLTSRTEENI
jgi:transposase